MGACGGLDPLGYLVGLHLFWSEGLRFIPHHHPDEGVAVVIKLFDAFQTFYFLGVIGRDPGEINFAIGIVAARNGTGPGPGAHFFRHFPDASFGIPVAHRPRAGILFACIDGGLGEGIEFLVRLEHLFVDGTDEGIIARRMERPADQEKQTAGIKTWKIQESRSRR